MASGSCLNWNWSSRSTNLLRKETKKAFGRRPFHLFGAQGETRTRTSVRTRRPERRASTNSATWASWNRVQSQFRQGGALY